MRGPSAIDSIKRFFSDPDQMARVERLRLSIHLLLDDGSPYDEPSGLARRTIGFVARNRSRPRTFLEQLPMRVPFRWADFAVAASIFIAGVLTLLPAIQRSRERMNQAGCVFNLQQLGTSLAQYASLHPFLPYPPSHRSDTHAGMFAVMLHDAGVLNDLSLLDCPCNGPCPNKMKDLANFEQVDHIRQTEPDRFQRMLAGTTPTTSAIATLPVTPDRWKWFLPRESPSLRTSPTTRITSRSGKATALTTDAGDKTFSSGTAPSAGSAPVGSVRMTRTFTSTTNSSLGPASMFGTRSCCQVIALLILFEHVQVWTEARPRIRSRRQDRAWANRRQNTAPNDEVRAIKGISTARRSIRFVRPLNRILKSADSHNT